MPDPFPVPPPRRIYPPEGKDFLSVLRVDATGPPGPGGESKSYLVSYDVPGEGETAFRTIAFQDGPVPEVGVTGLTNEVLLAAVEDRLAAFQAGPYACPENGFALGAVRNALTFLHSRTCDRQRRGVEGAYKT